MAHLTDNTRPTPEFGPSERQRRNGSLPLFVSPHDEPEENECLNSGGAYCDSHDEAADDDFSPDFDFASDLWHPKH